MEFPKYARICALGFVGLALTSLSVFYCHGVGIRVGDEKREDSHGQKDRDSKKGPKITKSGYPEKKKKSRGDSVTRRLVSGGVVVTLHVYDEETRAPIAGAVVGKSPKGFLPSMMWATKLGSTDGRGMLKVQKLAFSPSRSVLLVTKEGFCPRVFSVGPKKKKLEILLRKGSYLRVDLKNLDGVPVKGVPVLVTSFPLGGFTRWNLLMGKPVPGPSVEGGFVDLKITGRDGGCLLGALVPERRYGVYVLSRTMVEVDRRPGTPFDPRGDCGQITITLTSLYGFWAKIKGDEVEKWHLELNPSFKKRFVKPLFVDKSFLTGKNESELAEDLIGFMGLAGGADMSFLGPFHGAGIPCKVWLATKGLVTVSVRVRKVTNVFKPQVIDVGQFPPDPRMGKVRVVLQNPDGGDLPYTPDMPGLCLMVSSTGSAIPPGRKIAKIGRMIWPLSKKYHYLPAGKYSVRFCNNGTCRLFANNLSEKWGDFEVHAGVMNTWKIRMRRYLVPLRFRFFSPLGEPISYGSLNVYPSSPENISKMVLIGKARYYAKDFIQMSFSTHLGGKKIEDFVFFAPEGEEVIVHFRPEKIYGLGELEEKMVFYRKPGIQDVEMHVGRKR